MDQRVNTNIYVTNMHFISEFRNWSARFPDKPVYRPIWIWEAPKSGSEYVLLRALRQSLIDRQRPVDDDGILPPPTFKDKARSMRAEAMREGYDSGCQGPVNPLETGLRIRVMLRLQYELKIGRVEAQQLMCDCLPKLGYTVSCLESTIATWGSDAEMDYNPYGAQKKHFAKVWRKQEKAKGILALGMKAKKRNRPKKAPVPKHYDHHV